MVELTDIKLVQDLGTCCGCNKKPDEEQRIAGTEANPNPFAKKPVSVWPQSSSSGTNHAQTTNVRTNAETKKSVWPATADSSNVISNIPSPNSPEKKKSVWPPANSVQ